MSGDDIVFEDVRYREPRKARRPDRDRRWACVAYEVPGADDLPIFLDRKPADAIERHALRDTSVELGGILLGQECVDDQTGLPFVWVTECLEAKHYENTQASFTYTHDSWEEITRERDRLHPDLDIVGWYHTHPDFGIFLSGHDLFIHRNFFDQPLQVAYVVDPIRQTRGFFRWRDGGLAQVGGYYLSADRSDRVALARLANDLESLPNPDPGGGGLSPRLEAQLIAMLSRPHQAPPSAVDRTQAAAAFGTLGLFAGILLVAALAWFYSITQAVQQQVATLADLKRSVNEASTVQRNTLDALLSKSGSSQERFVEGLEKAQREAAESREKAESQAALTLVAAADIRRLAIELDKAEKKAAEVLDRSKKDRDTIEDQRAAIKELEGLFKSDKGEVLVKYNYAWYAAVSGWGVALLASLGLLAFWASKTPIPGEDPRSGGEGPFHRPDREPPHQIV